MIPAPLHTEEARAQFHELVRACYRQMNVPVREHAACLYWGLATLAAAKKFGLLAHGWRPTLQGGTAGWKRIRPEEDDGVVFDMFSYVFEMSPVTIQKIQNNELPEMHVWVACPVNQVVLDFTTGFAPRQCRETGGMEWTAPDPPPHMIFTPSSLPDGAYYAPTMQGTQLAYLFAERAMSALGFKQACAS